jgi:hypothetical protein
MWRLGEQDFAHAIELGRLFGDRAAILTCDENIDVTAEGACRGQRLGGRRRQRPIVVLYQQKDRH